MDTFERLKKIFYETVDDGPEEKYFTREARLAEDLGCNSISLMYMALSLEEEFGISFSNSDLQTFCTVGDTVAVIDRLQAEKN